MLISQAHAASEAAHGAHAGPFYLEPTFFVAGAFVLFFVVFGKRLFSVAGEKLDARARKIQDQIEEATRLREEAQELLASYEKKQHEALKEAEAIVAAAKEEAQRLSDEAAANLEHSLKRAEQLAQERIRQAEVQAVAEVKTLAVDLAMDAAKRILGSEVSEAKGAAMIDAAIKDLDGKLH